MKIFLSYSVLVFSVWSQLVSCLEYYNLFATELQWADSCANSCPQTMEFEDRTKCTGKVVTDDSRCFRGDFSVENSFLSYLFQFPPKWKQPLGFHFSALFWALGSWNRDSNEGESAVVDVCDETGACSRHLEKLRTSRYNCEEWLQWSDPSDGSTFTPYQWPATSWDGYDSPCFWNVSVAIDNWTASKLRIRFGVWDSRSSGDWGLDDIGNTDESWIISDFGIRFWPTTTAPTTTLLPTTTTKTTTDFSTTKVITTTTEETTALPTTTLEVDTTSTEATATTTLASTWLPTDTSAHSTLAETTSQGTDTTLPTEQSSTIWLPTAFSTPVHNSTQKPVATVESGGKDSHLIWTIGICVGAVLLVVSGGFAFARYKKKNGDSGVVEIKVIELGKVKSVSAENGTDVEFAEAEKDDDVQYGASDGAKHVFDKSTIGGPEPGEGDDSEERRELKDALYKVDKLKRDDMDKGFGQVLADLNLGNVLLEEDVVEGMGVVGETQGYEPAAAAEEKAQEFVTAGDDHSDIDDSSSFDYASLGVFVSNQ